MLPLAESNSDESEYEVRSGAGCLTRFAYVTCQRGGICLNKSGTADPIRLLILHISRGVFVCE